MGSFVWMVDTGSKWDERDLIAYPVRVDPGHFLGRPGSICVWNVPIDHEFVRPTPNDRSVVVGFQGCYSLRGNLSN